MTASQAVKKREDNVIPATIIMKPRATPISPSNKRGKQIIINHALEEGIMVTVADVENAQKAWGEGVVAIAAAHSSEGDYVGRARLHVESLYACLLYTSPSPRD